MDKLGQPSIKAKCLAAPLLFDDHEIGWDLREAANKLTGTIPDTEGMGGVIVEQRLDR